MRLRYQVILVLPLENVRMSRDKRLADHCSPELPFQAVAAFRQRDPSFVGCQVFGREERIIPGVRDNQEWMGEGIDIHVPDVGPLQHRVLHIRRGGKLKRRRSGIDADSPETLLYAASGGRWLPA